MKKCFLGVDFQYDFMEGGNLAVNGAMEKADKCADFLANSEYCCKLFTADCHPYNHMSFIDNGGEWPRHCVKYTKGAAIYQKLIDTANSTSGITKILEKGTNAKTEEYSIFDNYFSSLNLKHIFSVADFDEIHVAGIVGTICVKNSIIGLMKIVPKEKIVVLMDYTANFDDGTEFKQWLNEVGIKYV